MAYKIVKNPALLIVDAQNDFMPGGNLPVPDGDAVIPVINSLVDRFPLVVASQDWHPADHVSFKENGGIWPAHCVQGSHGAELHAELDQSNLAVVIRKGFESAREQYSCFDNTGLALMLTALGVREVYVAGLATDYCVLNSVLDACAQGLEVKVVSDAVRSVDVGAGDGERALAKMAAAGAVLLGADEINKERRR